MKDTAIDHSIGAALQACAAQAPGGHSVRHGPSAVSTRPGELPVHLTERQFEVLALLCEGLPNKLICRRLNIATGTVKVHISCILRELGVRSRLAAVVAARRYGLLGEPAHAGPRRIALDVPEHPSDAAGARQTFGRYEDVSAL